MKANCEEIEEHDGNKVMRENSAILQLATQLKRE